ncbi:hypothetical protein [Streptomyces odontomachi]|uniref:hypothetical protein n=1 Tax=Streptomyces odontomachi TaxID=2944940 RepID=UPI00210C3424|nr:hypothetical protein [Streptomyces sp. ODS25]
MAKRLLLVLLVILLGTGGYGVYRYFSQDTRHDVVMRHADQFAAIERRLSALAPGISSALTEDSDTACRDVRKGARLFRYDQDDPAGNNLGMVTYDQLTDPAKASGTWDFINTDLARYVAASAPGHHRTSGDNEFASDTYTRSVEAMAKVRYVLVVKTHLTEGGDGSQESSHDHIDDLLGFDGVIADLRSRKVLCTVAGYGAIDDPGVWYSYPLDAGSAEREQRADDAVDEQLHSDATSELEWQLNHLRHGHFAL